MRLVITALLAAGLAMGQAPQLTWLRATVQQNGRFLVNLPRESFTITEGGKPQSIEDFGAAREAASIGIVLDNSGSLREVQSVTSAQFSEFLKGLRPDDEFFLSSFSEEPGLEQDFTSDRELIRAAFNRRVVYGGSALNDTVHNAARYLAGRVTRRNKVLVVFSDGDENLSNLKTKEVIEVLTNSDIVLYGISPLAKASDNAVLGSMAKATGGVFYVGGNLKTTAQDIGALTEVMHLFYRLSYRTPTGIPPGKARKIQVKVAEKKARVFARPTLPR